MPSKWWKQYIQISAENAKVTKGWGIRCHCHVEVDPKDYDPNGHRRVKRMGNGLSQVPEEGMYTWEKSGEGTIWRLWYHIIKVHGMSRWEICYTASAPRNSFSPIGFSHVRIHRLKYVPLILSNQGTSDMVYSSSKSHQKAIHTRWIERQLFSWKFAKWYKLHVHYCLKKIKKRCIQFCNPGAVFTSIHCHDHAQANQSFLILSTMIH